MSTRTLRSRRNARLRSVLLALATASAAYVVADAIALEAPVAQAGAAISVADAAYELDASDPQRLASVSFTLGRSVEGRVRASVDGGATWGSCSRAGDRVTCAADVDAATATGLQIASA